MNFEWIWSKHDFNMKISRKSAKISIKSKLLNIMFKMVLDSPTVYGYNAVCTTHATWQYVTVGYRIHFNVKISFSLDGST